MRNIHALQTIRKIVNAQIPEPNHIQELHNKAAFLDESVAHAARLELRQINILLQISAILHNHGINEI